MGGESPPTETQTTNHQIENDKDKEKEKSVIVERVTEQAVETTPTTQTKEAAAQTPFKDKRPTERKEDKPKPTVAKPSPKYKSGYREFLRQVSDFETKNHKGKRHWVYIPDSIFSALNIAYGERRLSAVISVLAENHIRDYKDDMIKKIADKSSLFSD